MSIHILVDQREVGSHDIAHTYILFIYEYKLMELPFQWIEVGNPDICQHVQTLEVIGYGGTLAVVIPQLGSVLASCR